MLLDAHRETPRQWAATVNGHGIHVLIDLLGSLPIASQVCVYAAQVRAGDMLAYAGVCWRLLTYC